MPGRPSGVWHIVQPPTHAATGVRFHMHCPMPDTEHTHFPGSAPSPQPDDEIHIGLMSGTSMDGVDGVMLAFAPEGHIRTTLGHAFLPMPSVPHPSVGWTFTLRSGGVSQGPWGACANSTDNVPREAASPVPPDGQGPLQA